jgi:acyl-CoA synthetase (AMP-forming)/AMP-acid ligase II
MMNVVRCLRVSASKFPDKVGVIFEDIPYTYTQVLQAAEGLAAHLKKNGIRRGDKVCAMFYNSIEQVKAYFAVLILGAVVVPINSRFIDQEVSYIANHSDTKAILHGAEFRQIIDRVRKDAAELEFSITLDLDSADTEAFRAPTSEESAALNKMNSDMSDVSFISYTSGTTGKPKGAVLTHSNNVWNQLEPLGLKIWCK